MAGYLSRDRGGERGSAADGRLFSASVFSRLPSFLDLGPSGGRVWDGDGIERVGLRRMSGLGWKGFWDIGSLLVGWLVGLEEEPDG